MGGMTPRSPSLLHNGLSFRLLLLATMHPNILFQNPPSGSHLAVRGVLVTSLGQVPQKSRLVVNLAFSVQECLTTGEKKKVLEIRKMLMTP